MVLEEANGLPRVHQQGVIGDRVAPLHAHVPSVRNRQAVEDLCPPERDEERQRSPLVAQLSRFKAGFISSLNLNLNRCFLSKLIGNVLLGSVQYAHEGTLVC